MRGGPAVLLMDEPLASLDASLRVGLRAEIESMVRSMQLTTVYVTHDQVEALTLADRIAVLRNGKLEDIGTPAKIYADPGTAFVAAFLGSPPINMISATIWVEIGDRIVVDLGSQALHLPWSDPRSDLLTLYHNQPVMVGIRPDALTPTGDTGGDSVLDGRVHSLEYHGHEWLARLEMGLKLVDISTGVDAGQSQNRSGGHRRASLLIRLDAPHGWAVGQEVKVAADMPKILFFAADGRRIDQSLYFRGSPRSEICPL
jgi:multiple sugar transport system ATP-binding protein